MGCNCGGSRQAAQERLAAARAQAAERRAGAKAQDEATYWTGRKETKAEAK